MVERHMWTHTLVFYDCRAKSKKEIVLCWKCLVEGLGRTTETPASLSSSFEWYQKERPSSLSTWKMAQGPTNSLTLLGMTGVDGGRGERD